jgi:hypothetical protein
MTSDELHELAEETASMEKPQAHLPKTALHGSSLRETRLIVQDIRLTNHGGLTK